MSCGLFLNLLLLFFFHSQSRDDLSLSARGGIFGNQRKQFFAPGIFAKRKVMPITMMQMMMRSRKNRLGSILIHQVLFFVAALTTIIHNNPV